MFCRNCGAEMSNEAAICVKCGVPVGKGNQFCPVCGGETHPEAVVCVKCGASLEKSAQVTEGEKSKIAAGLLGIFLGSWGVHNFYLGFTRKAVIQIVLTCVSCGVGGIWGFIEGIMILCGKINKDAKGNLLKD